MPVIRSSDISSGGGLAQAIGLWNQFFGPASKWRKEEQQFARNAESRAQAEAERQADLFPFQKTQQSAVANEASRKDYEGQQAVAANEDAAMLAPSLVDVGTSSGKTPLSNRFWEEMDPQEQAHVLGLFTHGTKDTNLVPGAYNSWLSTTRGILPPLRLPSDVARPGSGAGGAPSPNAPPSFGVTGYSVRDGKVTPEIKPQLPPLSDAQLAASREGVSGVYGSDLFNSFNREQGVEAAKAAESERKQTGDRAQALLKDFHNEKPVQNFFIAKQSVDSIRNQTEAAKKNPTGANDISLLTAFMRSIDPGSTVREGEFKLAATSGGLPATVMGFYNNLLGQGKLTQTQRQEILAASELNLKAHEGIAEEERARYADIAERLSVPAKYFEKWKSASAPTPPPPPTPPAPSLDQTAPGFLGVWRDDGLPIFATEAQLRASGQPAGYVKEGTTLRKVDAAAASAVPGVPGAITFPPVSVGAPGLTPPQAPVGFPLQPGNSLSPYYLPNTELPLNLLLRQ